MQAKRTTEVIGIASGKGGVGKTTLSANLAVALAMAGKSVMLLDADLGLANAQIALGCQAQFNLSHVIAGEKSLKEIIVTSRQGVKLVPGASGVHHMAAISPAVTAGIVQAFSELDDEIDYLLENDIIRVIKELSSEFPWFADLDDVRKDAMIDISFNLGATKLRGFTRALAAMQIADYDTAAHEFLNSRWASQVGNRATELVEIIKTGTYSL